MGKVLSLPARPGGLSGRQADSLACRRNRANLEASFSEFVFTDLLCGDTLYALNKDIERTERSLLIFPVKILK